MVVVGPFAPGSCDFVTSFYISGAKFENGHINYQCGENFENCDKILQACCPH